MHLHSQTAHYVQCAFSLAAASWAAVDSTVVAVDHNSVVVAETDRRVVAADLDTVT